jgi:hypothetical protein
VYKNLSTTVGAVRIVTGPTQVAKNTFASFEANAGKGNYVWFVPQGWNAYNQVGNQLLAWVGPNAQCGDIRVNSADTDGCGASYDTKPVRVDDLCPVPSSGGSGGGSGCGEMLAADGQPSFTVHLNANSKTLDLSRVYEKDLELTIVRIIDSKPYYTAKMQMTERIDLSTLPAGSYVARVAPSSGSIGCLTFYNFVLMD